MADLNVAFRALPKRGQTVCGDRGVSFWTDAGRVMYVCLVDGIGHGHAAYQAATVVLRGVVSASPGRLVDIVRRADIEARDTRGGAMGLARIDLRVSRISYLGVGNIRGKLFGGGLVGRSFTNSVGIVGATYGHCVVTEVRWNDTGTLVLCSDGVSSRRAIARPDLYDTAESIAESVLSLADGADDASVLVVRGLQK